MEEIAVPLVGIAGKTGSGVFRYDVEGDDCVLALAFEGRDYRASGDDYFDALCGIREELELLGVRPMCYGASRTAYPSGMGRSMGIRGLKIYKLAMGKPARMADLVNIFDAGEDVQPATVAEQAEYYQNWLSSLANAGPPNMK